MPATNTQPSDDIIEKLLNKYPNRVPIKVNVCTKLKSIEKTQFLVPKNYTVSRFMLVLRNKITLSKEQGLFLLINNELPPTSELLGNIYEQSLLSNNDTKKYLEAHLQLENTFG